MDRAQAAPHAVQAMAEYLGIELPREKTLLWIAERACVEQLPPVWEEHKTDEGDSYYYNASTQESTYENPLDQTFLFMVRACARRARTTAVGRRSQAASCCAPGEGLGRC